MRPRRYMPRSRMYRHLCRTTSDVFDIIRPVEATARPRTTKLRQVGGGEIPSSAEVGSAVSYEILPQYFCFDTNGTG